MLRLVAEGIGSAEFGEPLNVGVGTVKGHIAEICRKTSRTIVPADAVPMESYLEWMRWCCRITYPFHGQPAPTRRSSSSDGSAPSSPASSAL